MHGYDAMTVAGIMAIGEMSPALERDEVVGEFGSIKRYDVHVKVWRAARLAHGVADAADAARDWTVEDCTCAIVSDLDDVTPDHERCGGVRSWRRGTAALEGIDGCTCAGHALDDHSARIAALRARIATASEHDAAWDVLTFPEQEAARVRSAIGSARPQTHYAFVLDSKTLADLAAAIAPDTAPQADVAPLPAPVHVPHTCGSDMRQDGEMWAAYAARRKGCGGCAAGDDRMTDVMLAHRGVLRSISPAWHGLQADRVARQGRWTALDGAGLGAARIATATGTAGQGRGH